MICLFDRHKWNGCVCSRCGEVRHSYEEVDFMLEEGAGCCWDSSEPCTGPHCGTFCDSYYPGRAGTKHVTLRCRVCGHEEEWTEYVEDPSGRR